MAIFINNGDVTNPNNVGQFGATEESIGAYKQAGEYAQDAEYWAKLAEHGYGSIDELLKVVEELLKQGVLLAQDIEDLKRDFAAQDERLTQLISQTNAAVDSANNAIILMDQKIAEVQAQLDILKNMYVTVETLPANTPATGTYDPTTGELHLGIPQGAPGSVTDLDDAPIGVPDVDDWGFYVESTDNTVHKALMSDIAKTFPSITSVAVGTGSPEQGDVTVTAAKLGLGNVQNVASYSKTESDTKSKGYVKTYRTKALAVADAVNRQVDEVVLVWNDLTYDFYTVVAGASGQPNTLSASTTKTEKRIITVNLKEPDATGNIDVTIPAGNPSLYLGEMLLFPYDPNKPVTYSGIQPADGRLIPKANAVDLGPSLVTGQLPVVSETEWQAGAKHYFSWGKLADGVTDADATNYINVRLPDWTDGTAMRSPSSTGDASYAGQEQVQIPYITMVNGVAPVEADGKVVVPFSTFLSYVLRNTAILQGTDSSGQVKSLIGLDSAGSVSVGDTTVPLTFKSSVPMVVSDGVTSGKVYTETNKPLPSDLGAAASGSNSDITSVSALTGISSNVSVTGTFNFTKSPTTITPVNPTEIPNKKYVDDKVGSGSGSGGYIGQVLWHDNRAKPADGTVAADGQELDQTGPMAALYADVVAGNRPTCTEAEWQADPMKRGCYVATSSTGKFRLPDLNGVKSGSFAAPVLRGDGATLAAGTMQKGGIPNIKGRIQSATDYGLVNTGAPSTGSFSVDETVSLKNLQGGDQTTSRAVLLNASASSAVYQDGLTEVRMNSVVGCYVIRYAGSAQNAGSLDAMTLSTRIESVNTDLQAKNIATNARIGYSLVDFGTLNATTTPNATITKANPFGNSTPVRVVAEIQYNGVWCDVGWVLSAAGTFGVRAMYVEGQGIVVRTGAALSSIASNNGHIFTSMPDNYKGPAPCRVHVWKTTA